MIRIGTSGFYYAGWGSFYPKGLKPEQRLTYYAQEFDAVELNFSAYTLPTAKQLANMGKRVPEHFLFSVKGPMEITHRLTADTNFFRAFAEAVQPLAELKKLSCALLQFPYSFHNNAGNRAYLRKIREMLPDLPIVVEFRTRDWLTESAREQTFALLRELSMGYCCVDMPRIESLPPPIEALTSSIGYVRFHGRNKSSWWEHDQSADRYDYHYSREELGEWVPKIHWLADKAAVVLVFTNNHARAEAVDAARELKRML
jgi:uncharacterized protein YecE (DUF72 family)